MAAADPPVEQSPEERLAELEQENARLQGENTVLREKPVVPVAQELAPTPAKVFTRAELQTRADAGDLQESEIDGILDRQNENRTRTIVQEEGDRVRREVNTQNELRGFQSARPELLDPNSDLRKRVVEKFQMLREHGDADDAVTELKAYKAVMGNSPPKGSNLTPGRRPTTQEGSGGSHAPARKAPSDGAVELDGDGFPTTLKPHIKKNYQKQIDLGQYSGVDDPRLQAELQYAEGGAKGTASHRTRRQKTERASKIRRVSA
jgi:hypothetical protein